MDTSEVERELEELESRIERLRALYEQYFLGIEKLEPQIQRKDVDRRITILRREQIRNTGLRFKFQMLVQRFNTMQQYWQRVTREIENGTYRRDVIRAAARVGAKEALTIVGKKRAAQYERLMVAQQERLGKRAAKVEEEVLEEAELIDDEDDAPTPPSRKVDVEPQRAPIVAPAPGLGWPRVPATNAQAGAPAQTKSFGLRLGSRPNAPVNADLDFGATPLPESRPVEASKPDPEAVKRRVAALAAQMRAPKAEAPKDDFGALDLELDDELGSRRRGGKSVRPPPPEPATPAPAPAPRRSGGFGEIKLTDDLVAPTEATNAPKPAQTAPRPAAQAPMRSLAAPIGRPPGFHSRPLPPPEAASSPLPRASSPQAPQAPPTPRAPVERPAPAPPPTAAPGDIDDKRMRQIYAKYVETKRASNESTAGVTFEKLATSLRAQAEKLRAQHKKNVDYEVIVKDGKTILKPILR